MKFKINCLNESEELKVFYYDNIDNVLSDETGEIIEYPEYNEYNLSEYTNFSSDKPLTKSNLITTLKIQFGMNCNYSCTYCSQRFVQRPAPTSKKDIDIFIAKLNNLEFDESLGLKIELWGGEPLLYWKTIKPLVTELNKKFDDWTIKPKFTMISNGSLLTQEINDWIVENLTAFSISHDGPGQHVRGKDPFDDPKTIELIHDLINRMGNRISFNAMLNKNNISRKKINEWFIEKLQTTRLVHGEGALIDAYDEGGIDLSLDTYLEHFEFRQTAFNDILSTNGEFGFIGILQKIDNFVNGVLTHRNAKYLGQKCGMDNEHSISVDLKGNVFTCQNVSAVSINSNGKPHLGGNIENIGDVKIHSSTHWSNRPHCANCPVLQICGGSCMFAHGEFWNKSCENAYSDNIVLFAMAIYRITGYIPSVIESDDLPLHRGDIWGNIFEHKEPKKDFPIKIVSILE